MIQKSHRKQVSRREGINYQPGLGCEYYVRVQQSTWEQLKQYQESIGMATPDGAILRLLELSQQES
jgi:hypothetical protein